MTIMYRVLYVDDEPDLLRIGKSFLEESGEFIVTTATSASEGIRLLGQDTFDAIISDYKMPDIDGIRFLVEVRERFGSIPFILFTGKGREEIVIQAINNGADFYVQKGGEPKAQFAELSHKVRSAVFRINAVEALRKSEEKYRSMVDASPDMIWEIDRTGNFTYMSSQSVTQFGYLQKDLIGKSVFSLIPPESVPAIKTVFLETVRDKSHIRTIDVQAKRRDGSPCILEIRSVPILGNDGQLTGFRGIARDITSQKEAEEALQKSEEKFRNVFDWANDAIMLHTLTTEGSPGRFIEVNQVACRMLGYTRDELLMRGPPDIVPEEHHPMLGEILRKMETQESLLFETRLLRKDGTTVPVESSAHLITYEGKKIWISHIRDITERKLAEEKLRESEHRSAMLLQAIPDMMFVISRDYVYRDFRVSDTTDLALPVDQIIGTNIRDSGFKKESEDAIMYHIGEAIRTKKLQQFEYELMIAEVRHQYEARIVALSEDEVLGIVRDITDKKLAEEELVRSYAVLHGVVESPKEVVIFALDRQYRYIAFNENHRHTMKQIWGADIALGMSMLKYISRPDDRTKAAGNFDRALSGESFTLTERYGDTGLERRWYENIYNPISDEKGNIIGLTVFLTDVTDRKHAEEALLDSERRYRQIVETSAEGIWQMDENFCITYVNQQMADMLDYTTGEMIGKDISIFMDKGELADSAVRKERQKNGIRDHFERKFVRRDGSILWAYVSVAPLFDADGTFRGSFAMYSDLTNRKLIEEEVRSLNRVLEERVKDRTVALSNANEALEKENAQRIKVEEKLQGSYNEKVVLLKEVHHRVKNNLQIIASLLNLQSRYIKDETILATMRESQNRVKAMALVHEKLYRSEDLAHISLNDYIKYLGNNLFRFYGAKNRGIGFTLEIHDVDVDIDAAIPLGLITNELISNSLKYAFPEGREGEIFISVKKEDHTLTILFRDNGIGIPADMDWRNAESLGLRLVITLVEQMTGTVELDLRDGTQFTLVLHEKT